MGETKKNTEYEDFAMIFVVACFIWLTVFATFSIPGRDQLAEGEIDSVAKVKILVRATSVVVLGWCAISHFRTRLGKNITSSFLPWIVFALWAILSTAWSPMRSITLGQAGGQVSLILLAVCIAISFRRGAKVYLLQCVLALACYSLIYGVGSLIFPAAVSLSRSSDNQIVHPSAVGATASAGLVIATALLVSSKWNWVKPIGVATIPIFVLAQLASRNRLGLILAIVICAALVIAKGQTFRLAAAGVVLAVIGSIYLIFDPGLVLVENAMGSSANFLQRGQTTSQLTELSGREEMWLKMWKSYLDAPLIGHGYFVCSSSGTLYVWYSEQNHTAHNLVLQALVSSGLIGLLVFVAWNVQVVRLYLLSLARKWQTPELTVIAPALFAWCFGWAMLNSFVLGPIRPESAVYALMAGLIIGQFHVGALNQKTDQADLSVNLSGHAFGRHG